MRNHWIKRHRGKEIAREIKELVGLGEYVTYTTPAIWASDYLGDPIAIVSTVETADDGLVAYGIVAA